METRHLVLLVRVGATVVSESTELSFETVISGLQSGDNAATTEIYNRFFGRMMLQACKSLDHSLGGAVDVESVAMTALEAFLEGCRNKQHRLENWGMVLGLLKSIVIRKSLNFNRYHHQARRHPGTEVGTVVSGGQSSVAEWSAVASGPRPDEEAAVREIVELALARLNTHEKSLIEGFRSGLNHDQNAMLKGVSARTVQRAVEKFRKTIEELLEVAA